MRLFVIFRRRAIAAGLVLAMAALGGCMRENVCYEPQKMPEFGSILRAVPCDEATDEAEK